MAIRLTSITLIEIIYRIHNDLPAKNWHIDPVSHFMYHPSFLRWVHAKSTTELKRRGKQTRMLDSKFATLRSRPLSELVPPDDDGIADDVCWVMQHWEPELFDGGQKIPESYLDPVRKKYAYKPKEAALERIDFISGRHRDSDRGWYCCQGEEASVVCDNSLG